MRFAAITGGGCLSAAQSIPPTTEILAMHTPPPPQTAEGPAPKREGSMTDSPRLWRRGLVEFIAIFLGVTLSFLAEDWRETLRDRAEADRVLAGLVADLESDQSGLRDKIQIDSILLQSGQWLLRS
jgi:hypothetical protein